jgi:sarcosine oxidase subunit alpha
MDEALEVCVNGRELRVQPGTLVAAAIAQAGISSFRHSPLGQPRGPVCGMGVCMECRATVNGHTNIRSCMVLCANGMDIRTDE